MMEAEHGYSFSCYFPRNQPIMGRAFMGIDFCCDAVFNGRRHMRWIFGHTAAMVVKYDVSPSNMDVSKNRGTPKWMVYNEKPY